MTYWDISPKVSPETAVFPGDQPFQQKISMDFSMGDHFFLSSFETTPHIGAHADSPRHYHPDGVPIDQVDLRPYFGKCQVVDVTRGADRILPDEIKNIPITCARILFKTGSFPDLNQWRSEFRSLSPELIRELKTQGVRLIGIDTPSVDPSDSKDLPSHIALYETKIANLEGLDLSKVEGGEYFISALPLKLEGMDASPIRAVLFRDIDND